MAKKKVVKKKSAKKKVAKKAVKRVVFKTAKKKIVKRLPQNVSRRNSANVKNIDSPKKIKVARNSLVFFAVLSIISWILYSVTNVTIYENLFFLLAMIFGFVALAFLIAFLIFIVLRISKK